MCLCICLFLSCLCRLQTKCDKYWPDDAEIVVFGDITITLDEISRKRDYVIRQLNVQKVSELRMRITSSCDTMLSPRMHWWVIGYVMKKQFVFIAKLLSVWERIALLPWLGDLSKLDIKMTTFRSICVQY